MKKALTLAIVAIGISLATPSCVVFPYGPYWSSYYNRQSIGYPCGAYGPQWYRQYRAVRHRQYGY